MNNRVYDVLKWIALVALDAIGVAYEGLAEVWSLPYGTEIMRTCVILSVCIGTLIGVTGNVYKNKQDSLSRAEKISKIVDGGK